MFRKNWKSSYEETVTIFRKCYIFETTISVGVIIAVADTIIPTKGISLSDSAAFFINAARVID